MALVLLQVANHIVVEKQWRLIWNKFSFEVKHYYYYEAEQIDHLDHCRKKDSGKGTQKEKKEPRNRHKESNSTTY